jgi:hypothetical protein
VAIAFVRFMTAYLLCVHVLNLLAPAVVLAALMAVLAPRLPGWTGVRPAVLSWQARFAWGLLINLLVIVGGLLMGSPGKIQTYVAMLMASGLAQFLMLRGWRT